MLLTFLFIDYISSYRDDLTYTNYAATLSQMCSEARAKVLANNPDVSLDNPNFSKPAHIDKMTNKKRKQDQHKENNPDQNHIHSPKASFQQQQDQTIHPRQHQQQHQNYPHLLAQVIVK